LERSDFVSRARIAVIESIAARNRYVVLTPTFSTDKPLITIPKGGAA
jgi:hypothetical protein